MLKKPWLPSRWTVLSGILIVLAFPPWDLWPLIWVCLVPWFFALKQASNLSQLLFQGLWLGYFMSIGGFYWVASVLQEFGNLHWTLSVVALQLFSLVNQAQFLGFALFCHFYNAALNSIKKTRNQPRNKNTSTTGLIFSFIFFSLVYTGIDWLTPKVFMDTLGHAFYHATWIRQVSDIGGPYLLTFLVFLANYSIWHVCQQKWILKKPQPLRQLLAPVGAAIALVLIATVYGGIRYYHIRNSVVHAKDTVQVAAIQANIGDFEKVAAERGLVRAAHRILDTYMSLTREAMQLIPRPNLVIWPETAYPTTFGTPHHYYETELEATVQSFAKQLTVPLIFGGYDHQDGKDFNALFFLTPENQLQVYQKNMILMFGEYIPGAEYFEFIRRWFPQVGNFGRGIGPSVMDLEITQSGSKKTTRVGPIICYEALFPNYVIQEANLGSQFLINVTNDSWFGPWGEPYLHLALTTFRSIETRLPMIRATNTGISTLITADGEITQPTAVGTAGILNVNIPVTDPIPTLVKKWGEWFGPLSAGLTILSLILFTLSRFNVRFGWIWKDLPYRPLGFPVGSDRRSLDHE